MNFVQFQYKGPMKVASDLKIFVGGIGIGTSEEDVKNYFSTFGKVYGFQVFCLIL